MILERLGMLDIKEIPSTKEPDGGVDTRSIKGGNLSQCQKSTRETYYG